MISFRFHLLALAPALLAAMAGLRAAEPEVGPVELPAAARHTVDFDREIRPLLEARCVSCHGPERQKGGLRLDDPRAAKAGGDTRAPDIRPGDSVGSPLIQLVAGQVPDLVMPQKGERLTAAEIGLLRAWIDQGAAWPETARASSDPALNHWAFQPIPRPAIPRGRGSGGNPVDAFVAARLAEKGLKPSAEADRTTLLRRLYLVMLGVPPTPEDVSAFLADPRPDAFERRVDEVLNDTRYGERWGRHWLDVIRFAESNGFETNRERPNAWRFRDYVIAAFNSDKPFDRFVREQIAGDQLGEDVATGFLVGGPVDIVGSPDISLTLQQRADELDDMVGTTGTAFLGLTLGCARCHSHKFDPVSHREYYALAAVFSGVRHGERPLALPAGRTNELASLDARIRDLEQSLEPFKVAPPTEASPPGAKRPAVNARQNVETFDPVDARYLRFTILASSSGEPCLDELEAWSGGRNVALATNGTRATASGTLPGYEIHQLAHLNDGQVGNGHSWISNESGRGWVQLEFPTVVRLDRIVWGRDREGAFGDRVATQYRIEVGLETNAWKRVADSNDREPFAGTKPATAGPVYEFSGRPESEAAAGRRWQGELASLKERRTSLAKPPMAYAGNFQDPGMIFRLHRGDPMQRREPVEPGTLSLFRPWTLSTNAPERDRRRQLADWIVDPGNPLTARVIVNRIWQHQFGVGLVDTPNDFGKNGSRPTHPELLDFLARELIDHGWSLKSVQRLILTSATWRQSSAPRSDALAMDASSRLLWRFPPRRIEAESIRDSILAVSGTLDRTAGGPAFFLHDVDRENVYHYHPKEDFGPAESRRMVYAFKVRMEQDGVFGAFDCPDGSLVMPRRSVSTTPLQALNLFNSRFMLRQSELFADRIVRETPGNLEGQVNQAWNLAYNRRPDSRELSQAVQFARVDGLPALCRAVLNSNEFLFIP
ncbi:MAG: DUF1553 domain-containing protein [Verrucomicrobiota bacterium]